MRALLALLALSGVACVLVGLWLIWPPLTWIVGGVVVLHAARESAAGAGGR
ncbi:hypothetical protein GCM10012275_56250 [Longimycelium tulufanense]|uniref:Uncharacterized protein n=1 Tax=Longimycelium tulufanense TaxID=907463 RepID=A0A8J3CHJ8_9PSEU|nr:hypothetical protein [Longimycelium tulufanense]GGM78375.1 hypothetical protein GCM10012275_56250 [Longimycelium tulufanense]